MCILMFVIEKVAAWFLFLIRGRKEKQTLTKKKNVKRKKSLDLFCTVTKITRNKSLQSKETT